MMDWFRRLVHLPPAANGLANEVDTLHLLVLGVTVAGSAATFAAAVFFLTKYRARSRGARTQRVVAPRWLELSFAGFLLTLFVAWWVLGFRQYLQLQKVHTEAYEVHVVAKQWMWKFSSPRGESSVGVLVVPRGRPVRLTVTSRDVVHSLFIPALRLKNDAVPGRYTTLSFQVPDAGTWPIYCAEYCGLSHSRMLGRLVVLGEAEFSRYQAGESVDPIEKAKRDLLERGLTVQTAKKQSAPVLAGRRAADRLGCLTCHDDGAGRASSTPSIGPSWVGLYGSPRTFESGQTRIADAQYLSDSIHDPQSEVVAGFPPQMPTYQGQLEQSEEASIIAYIRSLAFDAPEGAAR